MSWSVMMQYVAEGL